MVAIAIGSYTMGVGKGELKGRRSVRIVQRVKTGDRCLTTSVKSERTARFVSQYYSNQQNEIESTIAFVLTLRIC